MTAHDEEPISVNNQPVSLGCGTLILIGLIVLIFSNANSGNEQQIRDLRSDVKALTEEVRKLRKLILAEDADGGNVAAPEKEDLD